MEEEFAGYNFLLKGLVMNALEEIPSWQLQVWYNEWSLEAMDGGHSENNCEACNKVYATAHQSVKSIFEWMDCLVKITPNKLPDAIGFDVAIDCINCAIAYTVAHYRKYKNLQQCLDNFSSAWNEFKNLRKYHSAISQVMIAGLASKDAKVLGLSSECYEELLTYSKLEQMPMILPPPNLAKKGQVCLITRDEELDNTEPRSKSKF